MDISTSYNLDPFTYNNRISFLQWVKMLIMTVTIFPLRVIGIAILLIFCFSIAYLTISKTKTKSHHPMSGYRKRILLPLFIFFARSVFFFCGFYRIRVKGKRATVKDAPILVLAPHSSFFDALVVVTLGMNTVVAKLESASSPIGPFLLMTQPILVNREDPSSRQNTLHEIRHRSYSDGLWPQLLIFPEGTCTNRSCLVSFKHGAFSAGVSVQPVLVRWTNSLDTTTWTWNGPGFLKIFWMTLCQLINNLEIEFLPVYTPSEEERNDSSLYAFNVRAIMAKALNVPTTDYSYNNCHRIRMARRFGLPMAKDILAYNTLIKAIFTPEDELKSDGLLETREERLQRISRRLQGLAQAARKYPHSTCAISHLESLLPPLFHSHLLEPPQGDLENLLIVGQHEHNEETVDLRTVVIGIYMLVFADSPLVAIQHSFMVFEPVLHGVDLGDLMQRVISEQDLFVFLRVAYGQQAEAIISFLKRASPSLPLTNSSDSPPNSPTGKTRLGALTMSPVSLCSHLSAFHPSVLDAYAAYQQEMARVTLQQTRPSHLGDVPLGGEVFFCSPLEASHLSGLLSDPQLSPNPNLHPQPLPWS